MSIGFIEWTNPNWCRLATQLDPGLPGAWWWILINSVDYILKNNWFSIFNFGKLFGIPERYAILDFVVNNYIWF